MEQNRINCKQGCSKKIATGTSLQVDSEEESKVTRICVLLSKTEPHRLPQEALRPGTRSLLKWLDQYGADKITWCRQSWQKNCHHGWQQESGPGWWISLPVTNVKGLALCLYGYIEGWYAARYFHRTLRRYCRRPASLIASGGITSIDDLKAVALGCEEPHRESVVRRQDRTERITRCRVS